MVLEVKYLTNISQIVLLINVKQVYIYSKKVIKIQLEILVEVP